MTPNLGIPAEHAAFRALRAAHPHLAGELAPALREARAIGLGRLWSALALGASISLDGLAIGFSAGLLDLPIVPMAIAIGLQAFVVTQIGIRVGAKVGERAREAAEGR